VTVSNTTAESRFLFFAIVLNALDQASASGQACGTMLPMKSACAQQLALSPPASWVGRVSPDKLGKVSANHEQAFISQ